MPPAAPIPKNEVKRLKVLWQYDVLDTVPEEVFDDLTDLAAHICEAPVALISLVDENRQWFKSRVGMSLKETSRDISFCAHAILNDDLLVISDATKDPRFRDNPMVTGPQENSLLCRRTIGHAGRSCTGHALRSGQEAAQAAFRATEGIARPGPDMWSANSNFVDMRGTRCA